MAHNITESSIRLSRCPHCNVADPLLMMVGEFLTVDSKSTRYRWKNYSCSRCGQVVVGGCRDTHLTISVLFPSGDKMQEGLPAKPAAFLSQALESLHAPSGCIMLCASAVDSMLKEKGLKTGNLYGRIEKAATDGLITKEMSAWAHEIRLDANDERHADEQAPLPTVDDAKKCVEFVKALVEFMFVLPSKVERGRAAANNP